MKWNKFYSAWSSKKKKTHKANWNNHGMIA